MVAAIAAAISAVAASAGFVVCITRLMGRLETQILFLEVFGYKWILSPLGGTLHTHTTAGTPTHLAWLLLRAALALAAVAIHSSDGILRHSLPRQQQQHLAVGAVGVLLAGPET
jgi:hypothetical protein